MFDIIIATHNRKESVSKLCNSLLKLNSNLLNMIIIVDSSDESYNLSHPKILYVTSKYQNQPFQRYLGFIKSSSRFLLFIDDDMELIKNSVFNDCQNILSNKSIVGINLNFENNNKSLELINKQKNRFNVKNIKKIIGYPEVDDNEYKFCGIKGKRVSGKNIEYLSGGSFVIRRDFSYINFNMQLFDIYEDNLGKGEDGITGFTLSKNGIIYATTRSYFLHSGDEGSLYSDNIYNHAKRTMYSRLFLSCEYYRLNKKLIFFGYLRYHHYALFRIIGAIFRCFIKYDRVNKKLLSGYISGYCKSLFFIFNNDISKNLYWQKNAKKL